MSESKYIETIMIDVTGNLTDRHFKGEFKVKTRLSMRDDLRRSQNLRAFLGGSLDGIDARGMEVANILADLSVLIVEAPDWWKESAGGLDLEDDNVLGAVHSQLMAPFLKNLKDLAAKADAAKKELGEAK
jgi:hypothetical protein